MLKSKIHRATLTGCDLNYEGSITIDEELMEKADLLEGEQVHVLNIDNGARFVTYVISGARGAGEILLNGAAARPRPPAYARNSSRSYQNFKAFREAPWPFGLHRSVTRSPRRSAPAAHPAR